MATNSRDTRDGLRRTVGRLESHSAQSSLVEITTRETRLKQLILVGALASFLSIFGLTIAVDHQAQQVQQTSQVTSGLTGLSPAPNNGSQVVAQPQIRTRTS